LCFHLANRHQVETVVGIGKYASDRASKVVAKDERFKDKEIRVETILHPSPASPAANKGWAGVVRKQLEDVGIMELFNNGAI
jgi:single-strand selective monofunctional uracil DNA glycosylase